MKTQQDSLEYLTEKMPSEPELLKLFIGPRAQSYLDALHHGKGFSLAGLIFGGYWLLYRKMYAYFFLLLALIFFAGMLMSIIGLPPESMLALAALPNLIYGISGKQLYAHFALQKVRAFQHSPVYSVKVFSESGGTSFSQPVLWFFIQAAAVFMLTTPFLKY